MSYGGLLIGEQKWPFNIMSGNITTGYNSAVVTGFKADAVFANVHSDTYTATNEIGMQGPFTEEWVGGLQARHVRINRYDDDATTRGKWQQVVYGLQASGQFIISNRSDVTDQDTFTLNDGTTSKVFEFSSDGSVPGSRVEVRIDSDATVQATKVLEAIASTTLKISSVSTSIVGSQITFNLKQDETGTVGNTTISFTEGTGSTYTKTDFAGGTNESTATRFSQTDDTSNRPEAYGILLGESGSSGLGDGAVGLVSADYGGDAPDTTKAKAHYFRNVQTKRPVNVANIQYNTSSAIAGNFRYNYEVIQTVGRTSNNMGLRAHNEVDDSELNTYLPSTFRTSLPLTTHPYTLIGQAALTQGNLFGTINNNRQHNQEAVVGDWATGSFTAYIRDIYNDQDYIQLSGPPQKRYEIDHNSTTSNIAIQTGSSNTQFWNNLTGAIQTNSGYNVSYTSHIGTGSALRSAATAGRSYTVTSNKLTGSSFSLGLYFFLEPAAATDTNQRHIIRADHTATNEVAVLRYENTNKRLVFQRKYDDGGSITTTSWYWNNFQNTYTSSFTHLTLTFDGTDVSRRATTLYINGVSQSVSAYNGTPAGNPIQTNDLYRFFNKGALASQAWSGSIDEMVWFDKELTSAQVTNLYNYGYGYDIAANNASTNGAPFGYWSMGDHSSDSTALLIDSINGNNLTASNVDIYSLVSGVERYPSASFTLTAPIQSEDYNQAIGVSNRGMTAFPISGLLSLTPFPSPRVSPAGGATPQDAVDNIYTAPKTDLEDNSHNQTIIVSKFSAPGGFETESGYLDTYAKELSVHNAMPFRNLTVRGSGSGEAELSKGCRPPR